MRIKIRFIRNFMLDFSVWFDTIKAFQEETKSINLIPLHTMQDSNEFIPRLSVLIYVADDGKTARVRINRFNRPSYHELTMQIHKSKHATIARKGMIDSEMNLQDCVRYLMTAGNLPAEHKQFAYDTILFNISHLTDAASRSSYKHRAFTVLTNAKGEFFCKMKNTEQHLVNLDIQIMPEKSYVGELNSLIIPLNITFADSNYYLGMNADDNEESVSIDYTLHIYNDSVCLDTFSRCGKLRSMSHADFGISDDALTCAVIKKLNRDLPIATRAYAHEIILEYPQDFSMWFNETNANAALISKRVAQARNAVAV